MTERSDEAPGPAWESRAVAASTGLGLAALVLAAVALWSTEGGAVFVQSAFAALAACL